MSTISSDDKNTEMAGGNQIMACRNPYLKELEWGRAIDPPGLRIALNQIYDRYRLPMFTRH